jgi:hypothetical protein
MAQDSDGEDSVLFSLKELKRVGAEARAPAPSEAAPQAAQPALPAQQAARGSVKAYDPDDEDARGVLSASLTSLRDRVENDRKRAEEIQRMQEEEQRLLSEQAELARTLEAKTAEHARVSAERAAAMERITKARAEGRRIEQVDLARVGIVAEPDVPRPKGIHLSPVAAVVAGVVIVGALGGLAYLAFGRPPVVRTITVAGVKKVVGTASVPAIAQDFGTEIGWLAVGDVAAPTKVAAADDEEEESPRRARRVRRRRAAPAASSEEGSEPAPKRRIVLPPKPTGNGFVY